MRDRKPANVRVVRGRFPEDLLLLGDCSVMFAFWADVAVLDYVKHVVRFTSDYVYWIMNGVNGEFSSFWPTEALKWWKRRAAWLISQGFEKHSVETDVEFSSASEARKVIHSLIDDRIDSAAIRATISQEIIVLRRRCKVQ